MTQYTNFYFLHIRKTGGRYVKEHLIKHVKNNIDVISTRVRHEGWKDEISDDTYVFAILRDPVEYVCSVYAHMVSTKAKLLNPSDEQDKHTDSVKDHIVNINFDKKYLFQFLEANPWIYNLQSKEILNSAKPDKDIIDVIIQKYSTNKNVDKELLYERLNRINLLVKQVSLYNPESVAQKICNDLNIDLAGEIEKDNLTYHNIASTNLYNSLTEEDKTKIREMFSIDNEIYNNHSIFSQLDNVCSFCGRYAYTTEFDSTWKKYSFCVECINSKEALIG